MTDKNDSYIDWMKAELISDKIMSNELTFKDRFYCRLVLTSWTMQLLL